MSKPNILWITIESTRFDHTSLGDYERDTTPRLQEIASREKGLHISNGFSHSTWTLPSSTSILTGTYPSHHRALDTSSRLPDDLPTVAELLRDVGYSTVCIPAAPYISDEYGTTRGFQRVDRLGASNLKRPEYWSTALKFLLRIRTEGGGFTTDLRRHNQNYVMNDILKRRVRSFDTDDRPFFLYAHYGGPHHPYAPPLSFIDEFLDECDLSAEEALDISLDIHENIYEVIANGCDLTSDEWCALEALYDAEIMYADHCVGNIVDFIDRRVDRDTLIVITADHGELFGEYGLLAHKLVVDDVLTRVPLVLYGSGVDELAHQTDELVQHADVIRTAMELAGADTSTLQGIDLRTESREFAVVQRGEASARGNVEAIREHNPQFDASPFQLSLLSGLRTHEWKYVKGDQFSALYDPSDETTDKREEYPEVAAKLDETLTEWLSTTGKPFSSRDYEVELSDETQRRLEELGYR